MDNDFVIIKRFTEKMKEAYPENEMYPFYEDGTYVFVHNIITYTNEEEYALNEVLGSMIRDNGDTGKMCYCFDYKKIPKDYLKDRVDFW